MVLMHAFRDIPVVLSSLKAKIESLEAQVGVLFSDCMDRYDNDCLLQNQKCEHVADGICWPHMCNGKLPENVPKTVGELNKIDPILLEALCEGYGIKAAPARANAPRRVKVPRCDKALDWERLCLLKIRLGMHRVK
jgi:hypothetical protein